MAQVNNTSSEMGIVMNGDTIEGYGVKLHRLTHDKIELVRRWRNHPKISRYMEFRDEITPEMQEVWFRKIDNDRNYYYIMEAEGKEIGLINVRDVDFEKMEGEGGIFIWDDDFLNSTYSFRSSLAINDYVFKVLGLKSVIAHILSDNKRAIQYNLALGFVKSAGQEDVYNQEYTLTLENFKKKKKSLLRLLK